MNNLNSEMVCVMYNTNNACNLEIRKIDHMFTWTFLLVFRSYVNSPELSHMFCYTLYMYEILVTGPLCTSECAGECRLSPNLCKHALDHGCARVAHCVAARWRNFSYYRCPLRQYDVWFTCSEREKHWPMRRQHTVYTNKSLQCKREVHSSPLNK